ncbi:hypothetical protein HMI48_10325 [Acidithiobacillus ferrooxidans]|uniref:hypothetical protein n=1 Tax=Acidithiobacillus ferrooxidans TaxID=920 RepID=UPI001C074AD3|nr:hypothetical protein [Acidithiobacillus ferrooxidans]MBU2774258.1 hypothetical protein [Acidithiobacillus ferrooxidans]
MILRRWAIYILFALAIACAPATASASVLGFFGGMWALTQVAGVITERFETCPPVHSIDHARGAKDFQLAERYSRDVVRDYALASGSNPKFSSSILGSDFIVSNRCVMMAAKSWPVIIEQKKLPGSPGAELGAAKQNTGDGLQYPICAREASDRTGWPEGLVVLVLCGDGCYGGFRAAESAVFLGVAHMAAERDI